MKKKKKKKKHTLQCDNIYETIFLCFVNVMKYFPQIERTFQIKLKNNTSLKDDDESNFDLNFQCVVRSMLLLNFKIILIFTT